MIEQGQLALQTLDGMRDTTIAVCHCQQIRAGQVWLNSPRLSGASRGKDQCISACGAGAKVNRAFAGVLDLPPCLQSHLGRFLFFQPAPGIS